MSENEVIHTGYCEFCGDGILVGEYTSQEEADAEATLKCDCKEATKSRKATKETEEEEPREEKIEKANRKIDGIFADCSERMKQALREDAEMLIDGEGKRCTRIIDDYTVSVMFKRTNGRISIERKENNSERAEI